MYKLLKIYDRIILFLFTNIINIIKNKNNLLFITIFNENIINYSKIYIFIIIFIFFK
jgi:hypothetical protein